MRDGTSDLIFQGHAERPEDGTILFTSFFTRNTPYEQLVQSLIESLKQFGLSYYVEGLEGQGSWAKNTYLKAYFIRRMLTRFREYRAIVWLDGDSVLRQKPELFFRLHDIDLGIRGRGPVRSPATILKYAFRKPKRPWTLSLLWRNMAQYDLCHNCVMYIRNCPETHQFLDDWIAMIEENTDGWRHDQHALQALLLKKDFYSQTLKLFNLPPRYADKKDGPQGLNASADAIISQAQASTLFKTHDSVQQRSRAATRGVSAK